MLGAGSTFTLQEFSKRKKSRSFGFLYAFELHNVFIKLCTCVLQKRISEQFLKCFVCCADHWVFVQSVFV